MKGHCGYSVLKAARRHPDSMAPVARWLTVITAAECGGLMDVRKFWSSADQVGKTLIFNVDALLTRSEEYDRVNMEALCP